MGDLNNRFKFKLKGGKTNEKRIFDWWSTNYTIDFF